jgi:hypothetical protein
MFSRPAVRDREAFTALFVKTSVSPPVRPLKEPPGPFLNYAVFRQSYAGRTRDRFGTKSVSASYPPVPTGASNPLVLRSSVRCDLRRVGPGNLLHSQYRALVGQIEP